MIIIILGDVACCWSLLVDTMLRRPPRSLSQLNFYGDEYRRQNTSEIIEFTGCGT
jgi:hypothetical protein